jgi:hypothetical protein
LGWWWLVSVSARSPSWGGRPAVPALLRPEAKLQADGDEALPRDAAEEENRRRSPPPLSPARPRAFSRFGHRHATIPSPRATDVAVGSRWDAASLACLASQSTNNPPCSASAAPHRRRRPGVPAAAAASSPAARRTPPRLLAASSQLPQCGRASPGAWRTAAAARAPGAPTHRIGGARRRSRSLGR